MRQPSDARPPPGDPLRLYARGAAAADVLVDVLRRFPAGRGLAPGPLPLGATARILERAVAGAELERETQDDCPGAERVEVYVALASGVYRFDRACRLLHGVSRRDIRPELSLLDRLSPAPLNLIYVGQTDGSTRRREQDTAALSAINIATLYENVDRFCIPENLITVARGWLDRRALARSLGLGLGQHLVLVQSIGYAATP